MNAPKPLPPYRRKWTPIAPDLSKARIWREAIFAVWVAEGHAASCGAAEDVDLALAELSEEDGAAAAERALRFARARKAEHKQLPDVLYYVSKRLFDRHPPPPAMPDDIQEVKPRSRESDALFWRWALAGDAQSAARARALMRDIRYGKRILVRRDELPSEDELAALTAKVERGGDDWEAWGRHLSRRPRELIIWLDWKGFGRWPFFPSRRPPLDDAGRLAEARLEDRRAAQQATQGER